MLGLGLRVFILKGGTPWGPHIYSVFSCFVAKITLELEAW